jgi:hypothetical protein
MRGSYGLHERVDVLGVDQDRHGAHPRQLGVEQGLALHHGQRRHRPDVAEAQHARPVGADRDAAPDRREAPRDLRVLGDRRAHPRDARRVDVAHVLVGLDPAPADHLDLAAVMRQERAVVEPRDRHAGELAQARRQRVGVVLVAQLDSDLAQRLVTGDRDRLDVPDQPAVLGDPARDLRQLTGGVRDPEAVRAVHGHGPSAYASVQHARRAPARHT